MLYFVFFFISIFVSFFFFLQNTSLKVKKCGSFRIIFWKTIHLKKKSYTSTKSSIDTNLVKSLKEYLLIICYLLNICLSYDSTSAPYEIIKWYLSLRCSPTY